MLLGFMKNKRIMKRRAIAGLIAITVVVAVAMLAGCVEEKEAPTQVPTYTPTQFSTQIPTYQDSEYIEWVWETLHNIQSNYDQIANSVSNDRVDFESIEKYSGMMYDDARKALTEIDKFSVSPKYTPSKDELKLALQDYKQVGYYLKRAARYPDGDDLQTATEYIESAGTHKRRSENLMPDEMASYSPTTHMQTQKISTTKQTAKQKSNAIQLKVIYSGSWSGSYGDIESLKSVDGTGTETFTISDPEFIVSASVQKKDDSSRTLTVEILKNGAVVKSESTSAAYGVVLLSYTL
ncbi:hypothetical protein C5S35_17305 [Candidatus Methanophagaceae archaeon]|nr:hypothetical protein C5S35_17305 [Methanophagales archaeon]